MISIKVDGLDRLQRNLEETSAAVEALSGNICSLNFNAADPESVENAVREMRSSVDARVIQWRDNPMVAPIVAQAKEKFEEKIRTGAAEKLKELELSPHTKSLD